MNWLTDNWLVQKSKEMIWSNVYDFIADMFNEAFALVTDFVVLDTDINYYFNVDRYMIYIYIIAGSLLSVAVVWEVFKQVSGNMIPVEEKSIGTILLRTVWAGAMIYFLPWSLKNIILKINNLIVALIQSIGISYDIEHTKATIIGFMSDYSKVMLIGMGILGVGILILGIVAGKRYVEIIISYMAAPIVAISVINGGEALSVWVRESIAIVFTQVIHIFLLQFLIQVVATSNTLFSVSIAIGILAVMIAGPTVIRKYIYSTGVGSASVAAVGSAGRMAAFKFMVSAAKPS